MSVNRIRKPRGGLKSGMGPLAGFFKCGPIQVEVLLCVGETRMAKENLEGPEIRASCQQMNRKTVSKEVGIYPPGDPRTSGVSL